MATIADIARTTGLARTTVAEVLRDKAGYKQATREKVLAAAQKLGYQPNYLSKALNGGASMSIGVVLPTHRAAITNERVSAIEVAARSHGYLAYVVDWGGGSKEEDDAAARSIANLLHRRVDGLLLYCEDELPSGVARMLASSSVPCVFFNSAPENTQAVVRTDLHRAATALAEHLHQLGHRRAALLATPFHQAHPAVRLEPTRKAFDQAGIQFDAWEQWTLPPGYLTGVDVYNFMRERLQAGVDLPSVLIANNDEGAMGVLAALHEAGMRVPEDMSLVGHDGLPFSSITIPPLTTIRGPGAEFGNAAFEMLLRLMQNPAARVEPMVYECDLIVRQSTGPVADGRSSR